jgi:60 kDa SS-A/Ro ribonucleoprotein
VQGFAAAQAAASPRETAVLVREHRLPREAVKPEHLDDREVWTALLEDMPTTARLRNLATLTRVGVIGSEQSVPPNGRSETAPMRRRGAGGPIASET